MKINGDNKTLFADGIIPSKAVEPMSARLFVRQAPITGIIAVRIVQRNEDAITKGGFADEINESTVK